MHDTFQEFSYFCSPFQQLQIAKERHTCLFDCNSCNPSWSRFFLHWLFSKSLRVSHVTKFNRHYFSLTHLVSQQHLVDVTNHCILERLNNSCYIIFMHSPLSQSRQFSVLFTGIAPYLNSWWTNVVQGSILGSHFPAYICFS